MANCNTLRRYGNNTATKGRYSVMTSGSHSSSKHVTFSAVHLQASCAAVETCRPCLMISPCRLQRAETDAKCRKLRLLQPQEDIQQRHLAVTGSSIVSHTPQYTFWNQLQLLKRPAGTLEYKPLQLTCSRAKLMQNAACYGYCNRWMIFSNDISQSQDLQTSPIQHNTPTNNQFQL
jgi:hypothetical protein